jgi:hypothetical protein
VPLTLLGVLVMIYGLFRSVSNVLLVVLNLPQELARGVDAQLERGIEEVMRLHEENPPEKPDFGPAPDRSRRAYRDEGP